MNINNNNYLSTTHSSSNTNPAFPLPCPTTSEKISFLAKSTFNSMIDFKNSSLGKFLIYSIKENLAEFGGSYALSAIDPVYLSQLTGLPLGQLGFITAGLAITAAAASAIVSTKMDPDPELGKMLKTASIISGIAASSFILPATLGQLGTAGKHSADYLGSLSREILGGFAAINYIGSQETLWNEENRLQGYTIKCLQTVVGGAFLGLIKPKMGVADGFIFKQVTDSLIYNGLDIHEHAKEWDAGTLLNGILPSKHSSKTFLNCGIECAGNQVNILLMDTLIQRLQIDKNTLEAIKNETTDHLQNTWIKAIANYALNEMTSYCADHQMTPESISKKIMSEQLNPIMTALVKMQEKDFHMVESSLDQSLILLTNATNSYMKLLESDPAIKEARDSLERSITKYLKTEKSSRRSKCKKAITKKKGQLSKIIEGRMQNDLYEKITTILVSKKTGDTNPIFRALANQVKGMSEENTVKTVLNFVKDILKKQMTQEQADPFIELEMSKKLIHWLREMEKKVVGFSVTPENQAFMYDQMMDIHRHFMTKQLMINALKLNFTIDEVGMKEFYSNVNHLICDHYSLLFGKTLTGAVKTMIGSQIIHTTFQ